MNDTPQQTRLIIPALAPVYRFLGPLAYPFIRVVCGLTMIPFGWAKLTGPLFERDVALFHTLGFEPAVPLMWFITLLEFCGGALLAVGLLTRPIALMLAIELMVITFMVDMPRGRGYSFTLLWGLVILAIAWRGGGRYSVDSRIGREF